MDMDEQHQDQQDAAADEEHAARVEAARLDMQAQWDNMSDEEAADTWAAWCS
jgi:hypothetical protein